MATEILPNIEVLQVNKTELIKQIAKEANLTQKDASSALQAVLNQITKALQQGDKVQLFSFGTFEVRERSERNGRNPKTGEMMIIPASKVPAFKAGKELKQAVK